MTDRLTIRRPDDWHVHLRDGAMLQLVAPYTARQFARAIIMPNLTPPVTTADAARAYRDRIMAALPAGSDFTPLMTCYLTDDADPREVVFTSGATEANNIAIKGAARHARATTSRSESATVLDMQRTAAVINVCERIPTGPAIGRNRG